VAKANIQEPELGEKKMCPMCKKMMEKRAK